MEIRSLAGTGFDSLFGAFREAFGGYEIQLDPEELRKMLKRRGFDPGVSFAAFEGDKIVAFTLNGTGIFQGIPTAYDTGTGTLPDYRGRGLATEIFEYSIPFLKKQHIRQYLLEVLQHNTKAVSVYRNLGFETTREFNYFRQTNESVQNIVKTTGEGYTVKKVTPAAMADYADFMDFPPSWQNSFESIERAGDDLAGFGVYAGNEVAGYGIFEPASGDITQLAVKKSHRRKGIGSLLLREMLRINKNKGVKVINTDPGCLAATAFLQGKNIEVTGKQFEMVRKL